jgi:hypothetical protein
MAMSVERLEAILSASLPEIKRHSIPLLVFRTGGFEYQTATGTLVALNGGVALITAAHVLRHLLTLGVEGRLQIGGDRFVLRNVHERPINFGTRVDLASMFLTPSEVLGIRWDVLHPARLARKDVLEFEYVVFMGFPGAGKTLVSKHELALRSYECIAVVKSVEADQFSIRIDEKWYDYESGYLSNAEASSYDDCDLGGISGAPIFSLITGLPHLTVRRRPKLIGWVHEGFAWSNLESKIYAVKATALNLDGTIAD